MKGAWARSGGTGVCTGDVHAASGSRQARRLAGRQGSQAGRLAGKRARGRAGVRTRGVASGAVALAPFLQRAQALPSLQQQEGREAGTQAAW